jgi:hypothetical protein
MAVQSAGGSEVSIDEMLTTGGALLILLSLIQIAPIKINPWSALWKLLCRGFSAVGRALNADVLARLDALEQGQKQNSEHLREHIRIADERRADDHRAAILHFNVELIQGLPHTREDFIEILMDIDKYEDYCQNHPRYENNRAVCAIQNIKRVYAQRMEKHDFKEV